jgi:hypothetical protein
MYGARWLRQIANTLQKIVDLSGDIRGLGEKIEEHTKAVHAAEERKNQQNKIWQERLNEILSDYKQAERDKTTKDDRDYRVQNSLRWATWLAFAAAAIYGFLAYLQWRDFDESIAISQIIARQSRVQAIAAQSAAQAAQSALSQSSRQFEQDQRPYVWFSTLNRHNFAPNIPISVDVHFANYGKSPAIREMGDGTVFFGENALVKADQWFAKTTVQKMRLEPGSVSIIPPGIPPDPEKTGHRTTLQSTTFPTSTDIGVIVAHDFYLVIVMRIAYMDTAGNNYRSDICYGLLASGAVEACSKHNEIK